MARIILGLHRPPSWLVRRHLANVVWLVVAAGLVGFPEEARSQDPPIRLVVHPANEVPALTQEDLSDLLLGKTERWPGGDTVIFVDRPPSSQLRETFCRYVHERSAASVTRYFTRGILAGRVHAPVQRESDAEVLAYVSENPTAIGYVQADTPLVGVRELHMVQRPQRVAFEQPEYTRMAERARFFGVVVLRLILDEDGSVGEVEVIQHLEMGLSESAVKAARSWRYEPTLVDGRPVRVMLQEVVRFEYFG